MIHRLLYYFFSRVYASTIAFKVVIKILPMRKLLNNKEIIFINYRSFGHSIIDSYSVYDFYGNTAFTISVGEHFERNSCLNWIIPSNCLFQRIIPSWHRRIDFVSRLSLRKYVGPRLFRYLIIIQSLGLIRPQTRIVKENAEITLSLAPHHICRYTDWSFERSTEYVKKRIAYHLESQILDSNGVGTQVYASILHRVIRNKLSIPEGIEDKFLRQLKSNCNLEMDSSTNLYSIVISNRNKPHHGNGIRRYISIIQKLLESPNSVVIVLGDSQDEVQKLRNTDNAFSRLLLPSDFAIGEKAAQFLAILNSLLTFGDPGGIWCVFLLLGNKGIILDQIPTGELINRCLIIPRIWDSDNFGEASSMLYLNDLLFKLGEVSIDGVSWKPRLHNALEIELLFDLIGSKNSFQTTPEIIDFMPDELNKYLLKTQQSGLKFI